MTIIIKEISIRTTIERNGLANSDTDQKMARMRRDILREIREMLRKQQQQKAKR